MNPWLSIPLADYEAHMSMPGVEQAQLIAEILRSEITTHSPGSLAVLGCSGGNGLESLPPGSDVRVIATDINPEFVATAKKRLKDRLPAATFLVHDIEESPVELPPVELVFAALLFEYVDIGRSLSNIRPLLGERGTLVTVLQVSDPAKEAITPSPYGSLLALDGLMRLVPPDHFRALARDEGLACFHSEMKISSAGKGFAVMRFRKERLP